MGPLGREVVRMQIRDCDFSLGQSEPRGTIAKRVA